MRKWRAWTAVLAVASVVCIMATACGGRNGGASGGNASGEAAQGGAVGNPGSDPIYKMPAEDDEEYGGILANGIYYEIENDEAAVSSVMTQREVEQLPNSIEYKGQEYPVTSMKNESFSYNVMVREIVLPDSLKSIGTEAFIGCENLESIAIPDSVERLGNGVFSDCEMLAECRIGNGVTAIPNELFSNCYELSTLVVPDKLVAIGAEAFWSCVELKKFTIPENVAAVGDRAFYSSGIKELTVKSDQLSVTESALEGLDELEKIVVPAFCREDYETIFENTDVEITESK